VVAHLQVINRKRDAIATRSLARRGAVEAVTVN
jgi:hypothetical protein